MLAPGVVQKVRYGVGSAGGPLPPQAGRVLRHERPRPLVAVLVQQPLVHLRRGGEENKWKKEGERERERESGPHLFIEQVPVRLGTDKAKAVLLSLVQRQKVDLPAGGAQHGSLVEVRLSVVPGVSGVRLPEARRLPLRHPLPIASQAHRPGEVQLHGRGPLVALHRRTVGRMDAAGGGGARRRPRLHRIVLPDVVGAAEAARLEALASLLPSSVGQVEGAGGGEAVVSAPAVGTDKGRLRTVAVVDPHGVLAALLFWSWWVWGWSLSLRAWWAWLARVRGRRVPYLLQVGVRGDWFGWWWSGCAISPVLMTPCFLPTFVIIFLLLLVRSRGDDQVVAVEVIVTRAGVRMVAMQSSMVGMMTTVLLCWGRVEDDDAETEEKVGREEDGEKAEKMGTLIHRWGEQCSNGWRQSRPTLMTLKVVSRGSGELIDWFCFTTTTTE